MINFFLLPGLRSASRLIMLAGALVVNVPGRVPHADLKSSIPKEKSTVAAAPKELRLTFTEPPELALTHIVLLSPSGDTVALGRLTAAANDDATIIAPIVGAMRPGRYAVEWDLTGEDGHPVDGRFIFTVRATAAVLPTAPSAPPVAPTAAPPLSPDTSRISPDTTRAAADTSMTGRDSTATTRNTRRFNAESPGYVLARFAFYVALLIVIGTATFRMVVLRLIAQRYNPEATFVPDAARRAARVGGAAAWLLLVTCIVRLMAQSWAVNGANAIVDSSRLGAIVFSTMWGRAWIVQLLAILLALYGFRVVRGADAPATRGWGIVTAAAVLLAFTPAFSGHAAAVKVAWPVPELLDGLHVVGASGWLGSLLLILSAGVPAALSLPEARRGGAVADLVNAFSPTALVFASLVALTGVIAAWLHLGTVDALMSDRYGKILLAKLAVLSIVALTGAYNWLRVRPTLGTVESARRLRRTATVELAVAVVVLLITAILVATPTPMGRM